MIVNGEGLSVYDVVEVAVNEEAVELDRDALSAVRQTFENVQAWGNERYPIYGVNTGFGELITVSIPPEQKSLLQLNLLRSHAAGSGEFFSEQVVRAAMFVRLNCLMKGRSGASPAAVRLLASLLNLKIHPRVPQQGSLGASGDLAPLAHIGLALIGEGDVSCGAEIMSAQEALDKNGLAPLELGFKEALALINGTSVMTGLASITLVKAIGLLKLSVIASAAVVECLRASVRAFDHRGHVLKNHAGQITIAGAMRELLQGSKLTREHIDIAALLYKVSDPQRTSDTGVYLQNAYSLRCMPQVLGPVLETFSFSRRLIEEEINSCNDNPLIFEAPAACFHGGHFHGQYVAMASDYMNIALVEIGVLAERQLNRLLDPHVNGNLPAFLALQDAGLFCGFEGAQYLATSIASENLDLCAPASVKSLPSNGQNQDIVSMGLISARKGMVIEENVMTIVSTLVAACQQASYIVGLSEFSDAFRRFHAVLPREWLPYNDSLPIYRVLQDVKNELKKRQLQELISDLVSFPTLDEQDYSDSQQKAHMSQLPD